MKQKIFIIGLIFLSGAFAGCAASGDGPPSGGTPAIKELESKIEGPKNLEGKWSSQCLQDGNLYYQKTIQFTQNKVTRTELSYSDSGCKMVTPHSENRRYDGYFAWDRTTSYGGYVINYRFDLGNGWYSDTGEELLIEGSNLYLSDFRVGFGSISKEVPMRKIVEGPSIPDSKEIL